VIVHSNYLHTNLDTPALRTQLFRESSTAKLQYF